VWAAAPFIGQQFGKPALVAYVRLAALWIPFWAPLFLFTESLRGLGKNAAYQFLQTLLPFLVGTLLLLPVLDGALPAYTPDPALITYGIGLAISAVIAFFILRGTFYKLRTHPLRAKFPLKLLQRTALPILSTYLLVVALSMTEVLLLGYLAPSAADTGVFSVALRLSFLMLMPLQALGSVSAATIAGLHTTGQNPALAATLRQAGRLVRLATAPLWAGLCILSPWAMGFFGQGFVSGWPILIVLATNQFFNALCGPIDVLLQMTGNERLYRNLLALGLTINVLANLILIPRLGIWGAAIAHSLTLLTWNLVGVWRIYKHYGIWLLRIW
jgi:O-antigen/teichoic acid export membrane protein